MIDHFDLLASIYDRFIGIQDHARLKELLKLPADGWVLDAAGGTGRVSQQFNTMVGKLVVCDLSQKMLNQAQEKGNLMPVRSHIERLPFPDETFERILVVDSVHHFCNQQEAISDMIRVLKPGGRLVVEEPDIRHYAVKFVAMAEKLLFMRSHFYTPEQIKTMFTSFNVNISMEHDGRFTAWIIVDKSLVKPASKRN
jgi:ubiquinone/menaquinone biosynthesis C-methylase UbiE